MLIGMLTMLIATIVQGSELPEIGYYSFTEVSHNNLTICVHLQSVFKPPKVSTVKLILLQDTEIICIYDIKAHLYPFNVSTISFNPLLLLKSQCNSTPKVSVNFINKLVRSYLLYAPYHNTSCVIATSMIIPHSLGDFVTNLFSADDNTTNIPTESTPSTIFENQKFGILIIIVLGFIVLSPCYICYRYFKKLLTKNTLVSTTANPIQL